MSTLNKTKNAEVEISVELDQAEWQDAQKKAFTKLAQKLEVKGFRKGQAPKQLARQHIPTKTILADAAEALAEGALDKALKEHEVKLIDRVKLDFTRLDEENCTFKFICPIEPDVTLGQYKDLGYKVAETVVTDEDIAAEIKNLQEKKADLELKEDGEVMMGDTVIIDFIGYIDKLAFDNGSADNYSLTIGSHRFIPGFEEQLIGMKSEETKEITVTFPKDYADEKLQGKEALFEVTVHEIKVKVLPEVNDEFVNDLDLKDVKTVAELNEYLRKDLTEKREKANLDQAETELFDKLVANCQVEIPSVMIESELDEMTEETAKQIYMMYSPQGIDFKTCVDIAKAQRDQQRETAERRIKLRLILEKIAQTEKIIIQDEDINAEYETIANDIGRKTEEIMAKIPAEKIKQDLILRKAVEIIKA